MIHVTACYIYPVKSCGSLAVPTLNITARGPVNDRLWMIVHADGDQAGHFITQRERGCEKLACVIPQIGVGGALSLAAPAMPRLEESEILLSPQVRRVKIWNDECDAYDAGDAAAQWMSAYLEQPCRMVRISDAVPRLTDPRFSRAGDQVGFADGFPLLVTSVPSLAALQSELPADEVVGMERFRPNIVLAGNLPFEEDAIDQMKIGEIVLEMVKPCARCKMTTIDQAQGVVAGKEPLATLAKVRRGKADGVQGVFFGQNVIARTFGNISVGDSVEILTRRAPHPALTSASLRYSGMN